MTGPEGWGKAAGLKIQQVLRTRIEAAPPPDLVRLSLDGITRIDVTFAAEAVVSQVLHYLGSRSVCVVDVDHEDVGENVAAAALRMGVPVTQWIGDIVRVVGSVPDGVLGEALDCALRFPQMRARDLALALGVSVPNASTRLKSLWQQGYLMREEVVATSGGAEFVYGRIG